MAVSSNAFVFGGFHWFLVALLFLNNSIAQDDVSDNNRLSDKQRLEQLRGKPLDFNVAFESLPNEADQVVVSFNSLSMIDDSNMEQLAGFRHLKQINATGIFSKKGLSQLTQLPNLEQLTIISPRIGDDALDVLARMSSLKQLDIWGTRIIGSDLSAIAKLQQLETLRLPSSVEIGDDQMAQIVSLQSLKRLRVTDSSISNAGLKEVAKLKHLIFLDISGAPITDSGLMELVALRELNGIYLDGILLREQAISEFREQCPRLEYVLGTTAKHFIEKPSK